MNRMTQMETDVKDRTAAVEQLVRQNQMTGLVAGCAVMTLEGELPVETLTAGDRIITRDAGMAVIRAIRTKTLRCDLVSIMAGSLGHSRPERDVRLPAEQRILIRDWRAQALAGQSQALIPARALVDGEFVRLDRDVEVTVYEIELDRAHVIYADGLEVLSFLTVEELARAA